MRKVTSSGLIRKLTHPTLKLSPERRQGNGRIIAEPEPALWGELEGGVGLSFQPKEEEGGADHEAMSPASADLITS